MEETTINGLTKEEVAFLYRYVHFYENQIKDLENSDDIREQEDQLKEITKSIIYKICYQYELEDNNIAEMDNEIYFTTTKTKTLSFLRHLRNAIAHCSITKKNNHYEFMDYNYQNNRPNMKGCVNCDVLEDIIKIFI